jgi:hypothetical protein
MIFYSNGHKPGIISLKEQHFVKICKNQNIILKARIESRGKQTHMKLIDFSRSNIMI